MSTWTASSVETNPYAATATITFKKGDDAGGSQQSLESTIELVFYAAILDDRDMKKNDWWPWFSHTGTTVIFVLFMVIALIVKLLWNCEGDDGGEEETRPTESSALLFSKVEALYSSFGTSEEDIESGKRSCSSSSEELYDGKICVICYDGQRNCFFIPCGHCVACYNCANRIMSEENKSCPICRTFINKVRKLHIL